MKRRTDSKIDIEEQESCQSRPVKKRKSDALDAWPRPTFHQRLHGTGDLKLIKSFHTHRYVNMNEKNSFLKRENVNLLHRVSWASRLSDQSDQRI